MHQIHKARAYPEIFHLLFMEQLHKNIEPKLYAVKGGCNLRFFFDSLRYSEDIDIDIRLIHPETLEKKVDKILRKKYFLQILNSYNDFQSQVVSYLEPSAQAFYYQQQVYDKMCDRLVLALIQEPS